MNKKDKINKALKEYNEIKDMIADLKESVTRMATRQATLLQNMRGMPGTPDYNLVRMMLKDSIQTYDLAFNVVNTTEEVLDTQFHKVEDFIKGVRK